jgi:hypothetical protein
MAKQKQADGVKKEPRIVDDYQSRTVVSVENPHWADAEHTMLDADVVFAELEYMGAIPFTAVDGADTKHGQEIWDAGTAGDYGEIAEYVPPPVAKNQPNEALLTALGPHQLRGLLAQLGSKSQKEIEAMWEKASKS